MCHFAAWLTVVCPYWGGAEQIMRDKAEWRPFVLGCWGRQIPISEAGFDELQSIGVQTLPALASSKPSGLPFLLIEGYYTKLSCLGATL